MEPNDNPYQAPASDVLVPEAARDRVQADRGQRLATYVVDYFGNSLLSVIVGFILGLFLDESAIRSLEGVPELLLGIAIMFAYYAFFEGLWARTPGKWLIGTMVIDEHGNRPTLGQVLGRTACRFIPLEPLSFFGGSGTGWHDRIPRTRVVRTR